MSAPTVSRRKAPNLYLAESLLARAFGAIEELDPDLALPAEEHAAIIRTYVDPDAVAEKRDEFVEFLKDVGGVIEQKRERAKELKAQADAMEARAEKIVQGFAHLMAETGAKELHGETWTIVLRKSPGSVEVLDPGAVPDEFRRVPESVALVRLRGLAETVKRLVCAIHMQPDGTIDLDAVKADEDLRAAEAVILEAEAEVRTIDKKAIQAFWKEHGDTKHVALQDEFVAALDAVDAPRSDVRQVPTVPGTRKVVTLKLEFK